MQLCPLVAAWESLRVSLDKNEGPVKGGWPNLSPSLLSRTIERVPHSLRRARVLVLRSEQRVGVRECPRHRCVQLQ